MTQQEKLNNILFYIRGSGLQVPYSDVFSKFFNAGYLDAEGLIDKLIEEKRIIQIETEYLTDEKKEKFIYLRLHIDTNDFLKEGGYNPRLPIKFWRWLRKDSSYGNLKWLIALLLGFIFAIILDRLKK